MKDIKKGGEKWVLQQNTMLQTAVCDYALIRMAHDKYRDGRRVSVDAYAEMALRTSLTRAYLQGESAKRDEWGVNTVIVSKRGIACPKCLKYVGRVFYDDVYGHIKPPDNRYPLLSSAIAGCTTLIAGIFTRLILRE